MKGNRILRVVLGIILIIIFGIYMVLDLSQRPTSEDYDKGLVNQPEEPPAPEVPEESAPVEEPTEGEPEAEQQPEEQPAEGGAEGGELAGGQARLQFPLNAVVENANPRVPAFGVGGEPEDRDAHCLPFSS